MAIEYFSYYIRHPFVLVSDDVCKFLGTYYCFCPSHCFNPGKVGSHPKISELKDLLIPSPSRQAILWDVWGYNNSKEYFFMFKTGRTNVFLLKGSKSFKVF